MLGSAAPHQMLEATLTVLATIVRAGTCKLASLNAAIYPVILGIVYHLHTAQLRLRCPAHLVHPGPGDELVEEGDGVAEAPAADDLLVRYEPVAPVEAKVVLASAWWRHHSESRCFSVTAV